MMSAINEDQSGYFQKSCVFNRRKKALFKEPFDHCLHTREACHSSNIAFDCEDGTTQEIGENDKKA